MKRLWQSVLLAYVFVPPWTGGPKAEFFDKTVPFHVEPVPLYPAEPARRTIGALDYVRGYRLVSTDPNFGGFSSMATDGSRFTLLSDNAEGVEFNLDAQGRVGAPRIFSLPAVPGTGWPKSDRDSEAIARDPAANHVWVSFETTNEIWRYDGAFRAAQAHAHPAAMAAWFENRGAESLARLHDGRFLAIGEDSEDEKRNDGPRLMLIFAGDPTVPGQRVRRLQYLPPRGFSPTDATELPDGRIVIVNRHPTIEFGFVAALTLVEPAELESGKPVRGREIARFRPPAQHDNFEAVAAVQRADGVHLWIAADDNQLSLEQSLLLEFRLDEARLAAIPPAGQPR